MRKSILEKYAQLLVKYSLDIQEGDRLLVSTTPLAEPLIREIYREVIQAGGVMEWHPEFRGQKSILLNQGTPFQLAQVSPLYQKAMEEYEAYLYIMAPYNLHEAAEIDSERANQRARSLSPFRKKYYARTATRSLKRSLCLYPTLAHAQNAGMSLENYENFVFNACRLFDEDPIHSWLQVRAQQQKIVDYLNRCTHIRYKNEHTDIEFSTQGRTWINSDGQTNMPSGEVYTSPVEDSVNGHIFFSMPGHYQGHDVEGVRLEVKEGWIERWEASRGKDFLDQIFQTPGARRFGEAAIGTNYGIDRITRNILFDEKMGGTVHMAIGQSYLQAGGKNESNVHWDMITDMSREGQIFADGQLIYEKGQFKLDKS